MAESARQDPSAAMARPQESAFEAYRTHRETLRAQLRELVDGRDASSQVEPTPTESAAVTSAPPEGGDPSGKPDLGLRDVAALAAACIEFSRTAEAKSVAPPVTSPPADSDDPIPETDHTQPDVPRDLLADACRNIRQILAQARPSPPSPPSLPPAPDTSRVPHALPLSPRLRHYLWGRRAARPVVPLLTLLLGVFIGTHGWIGSAEQTAETTASEAGDVANISEVQSPLQVINGSDMPAAEPRPLPVQQPSMQATPVVAERSVVPVAPSRGADTQAAMGVLATAAEHWFEAYYRGGQLDSGGRRPRIADDRLPHERVPEGLGNVTRTFEQVQLQVMGDDALYTARMVERAQEGNRATTHVALVSQVWTREASGWRLTDVQLVSDSRLRTR